MSVIVKTQNYRELHYKYTIEILLSTPDILARSLTSSAGKHYIEPANVTLNELHNTN